MHRSFIHQQGLATLPTVLALSILVLGMAVGIGAMAVNESVVANDQSKSDQAFAYAQSAAEDALRKIAKDKTYTCSSVDCYSVDMVTNGCSTLDGCATVSVSSGVGSVGDPKIITAKGVVNSITRSVQVSAVFDSSSFGEITTTTWADQ